MKADELRAVRDHLERIFGEPFHDCTFHAEDDVESFCANGCNQMWLKYGRHESGELGYKNVVRIELDGPKLVLWVYDDGDEKAIPVNLADPGSDGTLKQVLDAALRY